MSDDVKVPDGRETPQEPKTYSEEEFKKAVAERDKAKTKLREREEEDRKAAEAKTIEDGKLKEVLAARDAELTELRKKIDAVEAARQERRAKALDRVADPVLRKFAEKLTDAEEILEFLETLEAKKLTTHNSNDRKTAPEAPQFKTLREMDRALNGGGGLVPKL